MASQAAPPLAGAEHTGTLRCVIPTGEGAAEAVGANAAVANARTAGTARTSARGVIPVFSQSIRGSSGSPYLLGDNHRLPRMATCHQGCHSQTSSIEHDREDAWCTARGSIQYVGGISPPAGCEGRSTSSSTTSGSSRTARSSTAMFLRSPFVCPRGLILGRIGPRDQGRKPSLTCGDAVEPPIGIEPMTYSLRGSYTHGKHSAGRHLPPQPRQFSSVSMAGSRSCMPKIRPRQRLPRRLSGCRSEKGCLDAHTYWFSGLMRFWL
jgi:hypothetical protein